MAGCSPGRFVMLRVAGRLSRGSQHLLLTASPARRSAALPCSRAGHRASPASPVVLVLGRGRPGCGAEATPRRDGAFCQDEAQWLVPCGQEAWGHVTLV